MDRVTIVTLLLVTICVAATALAIFTMMIATH